MVELPEGLVSKKLISLARALKAEPMASDLPPPGMSRERKAVRPSLGSVV